MLFSRLSILLYIKSVAKGDKIDLRLLLRNLEFAWNHR